MESLILFISTPKIQHLPLPLVRSHLRLIPVKTYLVESELKQSESTPTDFPFTGLVG